MVGWVKSYFTEGNPLVRVGAVILLIGVGFLIKYVGSIVEVSITLRLWGLAIMAAGLVGLGWRLRHKRRNFALPLQGAGLGVLYLLVYAAYNIYALIGPLPAFSLLLALVTATILMAVLQNSMALAALGVVGGFLAPIVASSGQGDHVALFSFYLVLNIVIVVTAWLKSWRFLNWLGFVFTFAIGSLWGYQAYSPEHFATVEPFLITFVLMYVAIGLMFALRQPPKLRGLVDGTIVFGTPIIGFALQQQLLDGQPNLLAISAVTLGAIYIALWLWVRKQGNAALAILQQSYLGLGIAFMTLAAPIAFEAKITSALWAVEGCAVAWVSVRQRNLLGHLFGAGLLFAASIAYFLEPQASSNLALLNSNFLGIALIALSFAFYARTVRLSDYSEKLKQPVAIIAWGYAAMWWVMGGLFDTYQALPDPDEFLLANTFFAMTSIGMVLAYVKARWLTYSITAWVVAGIGLALATLFAPLPEDMLMNTRVMTSLGLGATWMFAGWVLARTTSVGWPKVANLSWIPLLLAWMLTSALEVDQFMPSKSAISAFLIMVCAMAFVLAGFSRVLRWPSLAWASATTIALYAFCLLAQFADNTVLSAAYIWWPLWFLVLGAGWLMDRINLDQGGTVLPWLAGIRWHLLWATVWYFAHSLMARNGIDQTTLHIALPGIVLTVALALGQLLDQRTHNQQLAKVSSGLAAVAIAVGLGIWLMGSLFLAPGRGLVPYLPVLNALDLAVVTGLYTLWRWQRAALPQLSNASLYQWLWGAGLFLIANSVLLRAMHFYLEIPYELSALWDSVAVQAALTIFWVLSGLAAMTWANARGYRKLWIAGLSLLGLAVIKLFFVDMSASDTLSRILAFFGVAIGLMLAGYFAPRPPALTKDAPADEVEAA